ncbi:antimicrobial peptide defensin 3 [Anopheles sinensis]|uniref:Antimicrobial peptide defensin 3 n=1 Tax=Anopheles sinensis TaxID=74873 RepID=A0A084VC61_ANOSI|nr:antimicrobial peptide defensin 3 [Anopheles sinensis]
MKFIVVSFVLAVLLSFFSSGNAGVLDSPVCFMDDKFVSNTCSALCNISGQGAGYCNDKKQCVCLLEADN